VIDVLLHVTSDTSKCKSTTELMPAASATTKSKGEMIVVPIFLNLIQQISSVRIFIPQDVRGKDNRMAVLKSIQQVHVRFGSDVPLLDPVKDMKITEKPFKEITKRIAAFEERLTAHPLAGNEDLSAIMAEYEKKVALMTDAEAARAELKKAKSLLQMSDLKCMKRVLRRLGYCTASDVIEVKGRIACELSSADELLLTEMVFNGLFNSLSAEQSAAILSCFVFDERSNEMPKLTEALSGPLRQMQEMARRIARVSREAKIKIEEDQYVDTFKPFMMDVVHEWCKGGSFAQICKMTDVFEGKFYSSSVAGLSGQV
jgi:ATP-dependent RNA helicase DOB1